MKSLFAALKLVPVESAAGILLQLVQMACSLAVLRWVEPGKAGIWQTMLLVESYALVLRFGVVNAMNREYPFALGKGNRDQGVLYVRVASFHMVAVAGLMAACALVASACWAGPGADWTLSWVTLGVYGPATLYRSFLESTYRSGREFRALARVQLALAAVMVLTVPLAYFWHYRGMLARLNLVSLAGLILGYQLRPVRLAPRCDWAVLRFLFLTGLPLFASNYLLTLAGTFPRVLTLQHGGAAALGLFSPVVAMIALGEMIPATFSNYFLPRQNFDYGKGFSPAQIVRRGLAASSALLLISIPVAVLGWYSIPILLPRLLPLYSDASRAMQWALLVASLGAFKLAFASFSTLKAWYSLFLYLGALLLLAWLGPWLALRFLSGPVLERVVLGLLGGQLALVPIAMACLFLAVREVSSKAQASGTAGLRPAP